MDWTHEPLRIIDERIAFYETDRTAWQHQLEEDVALLLRAEHVVERVRRQVDSDRANVRGDTAEIATLREERALLVPAPRVAS